MARGSPRLSRISKRARFGTTFALGARMALRPNHVVAVIALALCACVGDNGQPTDAGNDALTDASTDVGPQPDAKTEAGPTTCVFGTSHFDDGCKFGP